MDYLAAARLAHETTLRAKSVCEKWRWEITEVNENIYAGFVKELCAAAKAQADLAQRVTVEAALSGNTSLDKIMKYAIEARAASLAMWSCARDSISPDTWERTSNPDDRWEG